MVNSHIKFCEKVFNYMYKFKAKKAKLKISKLREPYTGGIVGNKKARQIYATYIWNIQKYRDEYKFDCDTFVQKCIDKINA